MRIARRVLLVVVLVALLYPAVVFTAYYTVPNHNAEIAHPDVIIVLGCPTLPDGTPSSEQRERVMEGVREYKNGVAQHVIMTGAAAHNRFVEAHAMAMLAETNGVPASAIVEEGQAHDTIQNIFYSDKLMESNGWHSAEVISSPYHLPRTALILEHYPKMQWRTHSSPWPPTYTWTKKLQRYWSEAVGCLRLRTKGFRPNKYLPQ